MDTLSVCIIAKNEESNLIRCLESIKGIADEVILVDTGSFDKTISIAEKYNAKIIEFPWEKNFSTARNKALKMATKDWILCLDCDEALDISQVYEIKRKLKNSKNLGFRLKLANVIDNKLYNGKHILRIIRNNSGFYYSGKINEKLMNSIYKDFHNNEILNLEYFLYNYGFDYSRKALIERCNRNIDIYLSFNKEEIDFLYYYYIGNEYYLLKKYNTAANYYIKALNLNDNAYINSYITLLLVKSYYLIKKYNKAILIGESFSIKYNLIRELYFFLSESYKMLEEFDVSKEYFKIYLSNTPSQYSYFFNLINNSSKNLIPEFFGFSIDNLSITK